MNNQNKHYAEAIRPDSTTILISKAIAKMSEEIWEMNNKLGEASINEDKK